MKMDPSLNGSEISGEFIGLWKVNRAGAEQVRNTLQSLSRNTGFRNMTCADLFNQVARTHPVAVRYISRAWLDVDTLVDYQRAGKLIL
jgi:phosphoenolpyruvate phosphomutase